VREAYLPGTREGELLAQRWTDLELPQRKAGQMVTRRSLMGSADAARYRFPRFWLRTCKRWKLLCPQSDEDMVFPTLEGKPVCRDWLLASHSIRPSLVPD
jgi:hypothetical protein